MGNSKINCKVRQWNYRVEKDGAYETIEKQTTITSGQTIFLESTSWEMKTTAEVVICLCWENEKNEVVVCMLVKHNRRHIRNSNLHVNYVDDGG